MEEAEARAAYSGAGPSEETHAGVSLEISLSLSLSLSLSPLSYQLLFQSEEDGGDVFVAARRGRVPPHQGLGPAQGVDGQVHGGVLQAGGQGAGAGPRLLTFMR